MNPTQRVLTACAFQPPDRIPRFDSFWEYPPVWRQRFGPPETLSDVAIWVPDEGTFPTRAYILKEEGDWIYEIDSWGRTLRRKPEAYFTEILEVPIPPGTDPERVKFDPPGLEQRYLQGQGNPDTAMSMLRQAKARQCVFGKTGGPFLRTCFVRGEGQFLMDIASNPGLARSLAEKVGGHLAAVGVEEIHRWSLQETGIWIYDDMASNHGPMFRPASFEKIFLPVYRSMVCSYKDAGARYVFLHSDGDIRPLVDMLVDAGIDGLNPLEWRAGMDPFALRKQYSRLILTGGMDNTGTLIQGPISRIQAEARQLIDLGREGGFIIGTHSISPEIPIEHFAAYDHVCRTYGRNVSRE
jgi:hypothetical protein